MTAAQIPLALPSVRARRIARAPGPVLAFFVEGEPRSWQRPVTLIVDGKRRPTFTPPEVLAYEATVRTDALAAMRLAKWAEPTAEDRFALQLLLQLGTARRRDLDNMTKAVVDGLQPPKGQEGGTPILDDWQICSLSVRRVVRSARPGVRVVLSRTEETFGIEEPGA